MITREQIEEIQTESREKGVSIKKLLEERGICNMQDASAHFFAKLSAHFDEVLFFLTGSFSFSVLKIVFLFSIR